MVVWSPPAYLGRGAHRSVWSVLVLKAFWICRGRWAQKQQKQILRLGHFCRLLRLVVGVVATQSLIGRWICSGKRNLVLLGCVTNVAVFTPKEVVFPKMKDRFGFSKGTERTRFKVCDTQTWEVYPKNGENPYESWQSLQRQFMVLGVSTAPQDLGVFGDVWGPRSPSKNGCVKLDISFSRILEMRWIFSWSI